MDFNEKLNQNADKKFIRSEQSSIPTLQLARKPNKNEIAVTFEYS